MRLPDIMVAPNGAYKTKLDHPNLPMTLDETIGAVAAVHRAGAGGAHVHLRDAEGKHLLDAAQYRILIDGLRAACPDLYIQITTEAAGRYLSVEQRALILDLLHPYVSASITELTRACEVSELRDFYATCARHSITIQHIFYHPDDIAVFKSYVDLGVLGPDQRCAIFVLGRYSVGQKSQPRDLDPFLLALDRLGLGDAFDWVVCAFGPTETACLAYAHSKGGKARIGFENNLFHPDGSIASSNAERVTELIAALRVFE